MNPGASAKANDAEALVGTWPQDQNAFQISGVEGQQPAAVLQQDDPFGGDPPGDSLMGRSVERRPRRERPFVEQADAGVQTQDAPHLVVNHRLGHAAGLDGFQQRRGEPAGAARHGNVQAGQGGFLGRAGLQPVGHDQTVEPPIPFECPVQQRPAIADEVPVDAVGRRHDGPGVAVLDGGLEARQIDLVQRPRVHHGHVVVPVVFPVVTSIVFEARRHTLALDPLHDRRRQPPVEVWVFGVRLEEPPAEWVPLDVDPRPEQDTDPRRPRLVPHHHAALLDQSGVPGRAEQHAGGERGGQAAGVRPARTVGYLNVGDVQAADAAQGGAAAGTGAEADLFRERHLFEEVIHLLFQGRPPERRRLRP